jgi:hypothetical protein
LGGESKRTSTAHSAGAKQLSHSSRRKADLYCAERVSVTDPKIRVLRLRNENVGRWAFTLAPTGKTALNEKVGVMTLQIFTWCSLAAVLLMFYWLLAKEVLGMRFLFKLFTACSVTAVFLLLIFSNEPLFGAFFPTAAIVCALLAIACKESRPPG